MNIDDVMEEYLLTLDHTVDDRYYYCHEYANMTSGEYSKREEAKAELDKFVRWLEHTKRMQIQYIRRDHGI